jgi:hypothetical protein
MATVITTHTIINITHKAQDSLTASDHQLNEPTKESPNEQLLNMVRMNQSKTTFPVGK